MNGVLELTALLSSLAATAATRLIIEVASRLRSKRKKSSTVFGNPAEIESTVADLPVRDRVVVPDTEDSGILRQSEVIGLSPIRAQILARFKEAREALDIQERRANLYSWASTLLIFGQYIVGAALASSFVQETISRRIVGSLGLIVLLASAIQQRFRPDAAARSTKRRILQMKRVIRNAEDDFVAVNSGQADAPSARDILASLSQGIADLERAELEDTDMDDPESQDRAVDTGKRAKPQKRVVT